MARDVLINGDFNADLSQGWRIFNDQGNDGGVVNGSVTVVVDEGRRAVQMIRIGGNGNHCETGLEQILTARFLTLPQH